VDRLQQLRHQRGRCHDLLEVVEYQQQVCVLQVLLQAVEQPLPTFSWRPSVRAMLEVTSADP